MIPPFERAKIVHALDHAATVMGSPKRLHVKNISDKLRYNDKPNPNKKRGFYDIQVLTTTSEHRY
jgi:hypothetical protein